MFPKAKLRRVRRRPPQQSSTSGAAAAGEDNDVGDHHDDTTYDCNLPLSSHPPPSIAWSVLLLTATVPLLAQRWDCLAHAFTAPSTVPTRRRTRGLIRQSFPLWPPSGPGWGRTIRTTILEERLESNNDDSSASSESASSRGSDVLVDSSSTSTNSSTSMNATAATRGDDSSSTAQAVSDPVQRQSHKLRRGPLYYLGLRSYFDKGKKNGDGHDDVATPSPQSQLEERNRSTNGTATKSTPMYPGNEDEGKAGAGANVQAAAANVASTPIDAVGPATDEMQSGNSTPITVSAAEVNNTKGINETDVQEDKEVVELVKKSKNVTSSDRQPQTTVGKKGNSMSSSYMQWPDLEKLQVSSWPDYFNLPQYPTYKTQPTAQGTVFNATASSPSSPPPAFGIDLTSTNGSFVAPAGTAPTTPLPTRTTTTVPLSPLLQSPRQLPPKQRPFVLGVANGKKPTDPLTLEDLESILLTNKFVRESELKERGDKALESKKGKTDTKKDARNVAFPQPSILDQKSLQWGCTIAAGLCGLVVGTSLVPNLWLIGSILGGLYGYNVVKDQSVELDEDEQFEEEPQGAIASTIINLGRRLALLALSIYDRCVIAFYVYKTGQLSYEYYKAYAKLDQRFAIQDKVDAWNARFVKGKIAFDKWEKENEVGRKMLAGLRTFWLVEEKSLKKTQPKQKRQSKYRAVQWVYNAEYFSRRLMRSVWKSVTGGGNSDLREFLKGLHIEMSESRLEQVGSRLSASIAAILAVNVVGAIFAISPTLLCSMAILIGVAWPTWVTELYDRTERFITETRARGRGEEPSRSKLGGYLSSSSSSKYDGKKRPSRTWTPWWSRSDNDKDANKRKRKSAIANRKNQSYDNRNLQWGFLSKLECP